MATELEKGRSAELKPREKHAGGGGFFQKLFREPGSLFGKAGGPALDVIDRASELLVRADLPGLDEKDISVEVDGKTLTIWGERHEEREERDESYFYAERWEGSFKRSVELPEGVDPTRACASFEAGVLEVCFPKTAPKTTGRRIEVTGPSAGQPTTTEAEAAPSTTQAAQPATHAGESRRIEVTGPPTSTTESKGVTHPHTSAEDLGRH